MSQLERLARPFPTQYVKKPAKGKYGSYVPHDIVQQALLAILGPVDIAIGEVFCGENGWVEGCLVTLSAPIDGRIVTVTEIGDCEQPSNWKTQGARMKDAISDGVKRCAMRLGLGLHLWSGEDYFLYEKLTGKKPEISGPVETATSVPPAGAPGPEPSPRHAASKDRIAEIITRVDKLNLGDWVKDQHFAWPWDDDVVDVIEARCNLTVSAA